MFKLKTIQLILEHQLELCRSTYSWIFLIQCNTINVFLFSYDF